MLVQTQTFPSLPALFEAQAAVSPDATAMVAADGSISYAELSAGAARVAAALAERSIGPGSLVGVCIDRDTSLLPALMGILAAGAAYIPIDPFYPAQRIRLMLEDASPAAVLISRRHRVLFEGSSVELIDPLELPESDPPALPSPAPGDLAYVIYTSGSTGRPKGVMVEHRALTNVALSVGDIIGAGPGDRLLAVSTISFDIAALELFLPVLTGGTVILAGRDEAMDPLRLARLLDQHRATIMQATPATWRMLVESGWRGRAGLRAITGGEALTRPLADALLDRVEALWNLYGPTETTIYSTGHRVVREPGPVPIGRALPNTTLRILDRESRPAREGELYIGGVGVARGYLNRDDLTTQRFVPDPRSPGDRLYRTGDLCRYRPDGAIDYIGRADHQVKIRGYRIELGDVEAALGADAALREVVVGVRENGDDKSLVAYATLSNGSGVTIADLRRRAAERLPTYMLPSSLIIVDRMPRTPSGKTDRAALAALPSPTPDPDAAVVPDGHDDLEMVLLDIFRQLLEAPTACLTDDFFDLGGHSLLAFRAAQEIHKRTGRSVDVGQIFRNPTVARLAPVLRGRGGIAVAATALDLQPLGDAPPIFCVCGVAVYALLARGLAPAQPVCALYVDEDLDLFHSDDPEGLVTVERLAERYVEQIRARRQHGPYRLLGFSVGGAVAYEAARRLAAEGERIELVAMIDTMLSRSMRARPVAWTLHALRRTAQNGPAWALAKARDTLARPARPASLRDPRAISTDQRRRLVENRAREVLARYQPGPADFDVMLFNAADRPRMPHVQYDESGGWRDLVRGRLIVRMVPGDHADLLACPNAAQEIAATILDHLVSSHEQPTAYAGGAPQPAESGVGTPARRIA